jgi:hypothetical protein
MILGHFKNEKWNRAHFSATLTRYENIQTGVLFMRDHVPREQLLRAVCFRPLFLNLFGSTSRLKASFETTVPVKEICQLLVGVIFLMYAFSHPEYKLWNLCHLQVSVPERVPVVEKDCFRPLRYVMNYKLNRKSLLRQLTLRRSNNTWDFLNERKVSNTICE